VVKGTAATEKTGALARASAFAPWIAAACPEHGAVRRLKERAG
jgi:hypothetical protein